MNLRRIVAASGAVLISTAMLTSCAQDDALIIGDTATSEAADSSVDPAPQCSPADAIAALSLNERISQVVMGAVNTESGKSVIKEALRAVKKRKVTGVNFLGNNSSVYNNTELGKLLDAGGAIPPLLAVDQEGGQVQRLQDSIGDSPSAREIADGMTATQAESEGWRIGKALAARSLNMDFAPVADVGTRAIGDRTFSNNPEVVTEYAGAFANGLRRADVIPTLKHFPGLGSATGNTDFQTATTPPIEELKRTDLFPYRHLLDDGPVAVMFANAIVPGLTDGQPASLSRASYRLLRKDLEFNGVAITDSLSAAAISTLYTIPQAVEKAIVAGADIALWDDLTQTDEVTRQLRKAVKAGRLSEDRLNEAVGRVLALKKVDLCAGR